MTEHDHYEVDLEAKEAAAIDLLQAAGYTVTPPDPLAADREFLAGLFDAMGWPDTADTARFGSYDHDCLSDAMEYLRANKGRL